MSQFEEWGKKLGDKVSSSIDPALKTKLEHSVNTTLAKAREKAAVLPTPKKSKKSPIAQRFKAPSFWHQPSLLGTLLSPLGRAYGAISALMQSQAVAFRASVPVFCVGGAVLGGAGKTPVAAALAFMCKELGETPHMLSRGYGANIEGSLRVDSTLHTAEQVGDEPLLLARVAPTWVSPQRATSARLAMNDGATVLIMDDGLQHGGIVRDTSFLVIDTDYMLGNGQIFPAGPLREKFVDTLEKSHAIIALGNAPLRLPEACVQAAKKLPVFRANTTPTAAWEAMRNQHVFAFAGLARNEKFFRMCAAAGMQVVDSVSFPDHHPYTRAEAKMMIRRAELLGAIPVTTEKDAVKLHPEERAKITVLPLGLVWENAQSVATFIQGRLASFRAAPPTLLYDAPSTPKTDTTHEYFDDNEFRL